MDRCGPALTMVDKRGEERALEASTSPHQSLRLHRAPPAQQPLFLMGNHHGCYGHHTLVPALSLSLSRSPSFRHTAPTSYPPPPQTAGEFPRCKCWCRWPAARAISATGARVRVSVGIALVPFFFFSCRCVGGTAARAGSLIGVGEVQQLACTNTMLLSLLSLTHVVCA